MGAAKKRELEIFQKLIPKTKTRIRKGPIDLK
jgi:hypothetical protein